MGDIKFRNNSYGVRIASTFYYDIIPNETPLLDNLQLFSIVLDQFKIE